MLRWSRPSLPNRADAWRFRSVGTSLCPARPQLAKPRGSGTEAPRSREADRLDVMAVRIEQEGGVVAGTVIGAKARGAVVAPAGCQALGVEAIHGRAARRTESDVRGAAHGTLVRIQPQGRLALWTETGIAVAA